MLDTRMLFCYYKQAKTKKKSSASHLTDYSAKVNSEGSMLNKALLSGGLMILQSIFLLYAFVPVNNKEA